MNVEERLRALAGAFPLAARLVEPTPEADPKAVREPVTHDYTRRYWGHDYTCTPHDGGQRLTLMIWGPPFHEGDYLILPNKDATTRYRITAVTWLRDPGDMYRLEAEFAPRTGDDR
jgi:hypothetical protein